jgi:pyrroline-5-carboxylate reductase
MTAWLEREDLMDTVTALSGSGPAYFFLLVEALEDAAVAQGLPRETARALATQTCLGAGRMLVENGEPPTVLRERVTSPGGTTAAALQTFIDGHLRDLVASAVEAATRRGRELSEQYS